MPATSTQIQQDFDRLADLEGDGWSHNNHYHAFLLKQLPERSELDALEIGCGTGAFARLLAGRFRRVLALDLSPRMIEVAKERSRDFPNIEFQVADVMTYPLPVKQFGCVASIATLHHLPFEAVIAKIKPALAPRGRLLVLDLYQAESVGDFATSAVAVPVNFVLKWLKNGRVREAPEVRAAWEAHGRTDVYPTLAQVRGDCARLLPHARVKRHLLFRYSVVWDA
ncbi:MAG: class I SAM-dependent methyltransferase [Anaerolineales bacterium]|nr:class I SAM-dependent methyltransferase [Anaerolineales bacterium]